MAKKEDPECKAMGKFHAAVKAVSLPELGANLRDVIPDLVAARGATDVSAASAWTTVAAAAALVKDTEGIASVVSAPGRPIQWLGDNRELYHLIKLLCDRGFLPKETWANLAQTLTAHFTGKHGPFSGKAINQEKAEIESKDPPEAIKQVVGDIET